MKDYYDDVEMPGGRLKIEFHGDRGTSEQILMIPFRDGDDVKYFVVGGVREGYRRVTRYDMVRVMGLGSIDRVSRGCMGGGVGRDVIRVEAAETSMP